MKILENWRTEYHLYQVIQQLLSLFKRNPILPIEQSHPSFSPPSSPRPIFQSEEMNPPLITKNINNKSNVGAVAQPVIRQTGTFPQFQQNQPVAQNQPVPFSNLPSAAELASMRKELEKLKNEVTKRDEELTHFRAKEALASPSSGPQTSGSTFHHTESNDTIGEIEAEQIAISELMANLEEKFASGEANILEYAKLYKKYARDIYILNRKLEYVQAKDAKPAK
jgi:hypothetical protein